MWGPDRVGVRRLLALIRELPDESATRRHVDHGWTFEAEQLAAQTDLLAVIASKYQLTGKPARAARPWDRPALRRTTSLGSVLASL